MIDINSISEPKDLKEVARFIASHPSIVSKVSSYKKNNAFGNVYGPSDAVVINNIETKPVAISVNKSMESKDIEAKQVGLLEAIRDVVCTGARPNALTNMVKSNYFNSLEEFEKLFDPEFSGQNTTIFGVAGVIEDAKHLTSMDFKSKGHDLFLIGNAVEDVNSSVYIKEYQKVKDSELPYYDLEEDFEVQKVVREIITKGFISSAHNVTKGGLFIALMESAMHKELGFDVLTDDDIRQDAYLFGEGQGRVLVSVDPKFETEFIDFMKFQNVQCTMLGHVTKGEFRIDDESFGFVADYKKYYSEETL